jgi:hypothetical protein
MFLDVRLDRDKIRVYEAGDTFIRVRLGFQPSTSASSRSRTEVEQDRPARLLRLAESGINVLAPLNGHGPILLRAALSAAPLEATRGQGIQAFPASSHPLS